MLEQAEGDNGIVANTTKELRLVNKHWAWWATSTIEMLKPPNVPLRTLLAMVADNSVNLRSLKLKRMEEVDDEGLVGLDKLSILTCPSFARCNYYYVRDITYMGVSSSESLNALKELDLNCCDKITDAGLQHLAPLTSFTEFALSHCFRISDEGAKHIRNMIALRDLCMDNFQNIANVGVQHLGPLTSSTRFLFDVVMGSQTMVQVTWAVWRPWEILIWIIGGRSQILEFFTWFRWRLLLTTFLTGVQTNQRWGS